jgi:hypothetical protein
MRSVHILPSIVVPPHILTLFVDTYSDNFAII